MSTLIQVGVLTMTPTQFKRALAEDLTVSQALRMIEEDKRKYPTFSSPSPLPFMGNVENDSTVTTGDAEDSER